MCVIIDADCVADVFGAKRSGSFDLVVTAMLRGEACSIYGGQLADEYSRVSSVIRSDLFIQLERAGRIRKATSDQEGKIRTATEKWRKSGKLRANDVHIIALAEVTGQRLLCSHDTDLHADFTNPAVISNPQGCVFQNSSHEKLIRRCCRKKKVRRSKGT